MGEIADMMLDGTMDCETGEWNFDGLDGPGWPMTGSEAAAYKRATGWRHKERRGPYVGPSSYSLTTRNRKKLERFGEVRQNDAYHWQVRRGSEVVADWWPHKQKWRIAGVVGVGNEALFLQALAARGAQS
jgi:hypothetical protein